MELFAPHIDNVKHQLESFSNWIDHHLNDKFRAVYQAMSCIKPDGDDKVRSLWFEIPRGNINDFGEYEEFREEGLVESPEEFEKYWMEEYPDDCKWYGFTTAQYKEERFFYIDSKLILSFDEAKATEESVKNAIFLDKQLGPNRINSLRKLVEEQESSADLATIKEISAADFFGYCEVCYDANEYFNEIETDLSPVEKYCRMADRRDGGLCSIDLNSKSAFYDWYHNGDRLGAHPWEICRGGNSTHISFMISDTKNGWALWLAGSSIVRVEETVRMAVAFYEKGIPVNLYHGEAILSMVTGNDYIGIVPEYVIPRYCGGLFPEEDKIIDFMNLGYEYSGEVITNAYWYPLKQITV